MSSDDRGTGSRTVLGHQPGLRLPSESEGGNVGTTRAPRSPRPTATPRVDGADPLIGTTLAERYWIEEKLGEGGMGAVYLVKHLALDKPMALKVLHVELARKPDLVERFLQEARSASKIRHQNIIDITDFGSTPDGWVFFAMEHLRGHDLQEEIARAKQGGGVVPWARAEPIFLQICSALSAAHALGIVHRDLKPENIFLVQWLGDEDFVKLLDFGIAKVSAVDGEERKLTRTGMLFGTPEYMAPEQARGEPVDHRVDVYAMGCLLYQLITGHVPFVADNFMGVLSRHLHDVPEPMGADALARSGAPAGLEGIVGRALAKDREQRFQSIDELASAVRNASQTVSTAPVAAPMPRGKWKGAARIPGSEELQLAEMGRAKEAKSKWVVPAALGAVMVLAALGILLLGGKSETQQAAVPAKDAAVRTAPPAEPGAEREPIQDASPIDAKSAAPAVAATDASAASVEPSRRAKPDAGMPRYRRIYDAGGSLEDPVLKTEFPGGPAAPN